MRAILTAWTRSTGLPIETGCRARSTRRIESALDFASADYSLHAQTPQAPRYRSASRVGTSHQSARRLVCQSGLYQTLATDHLHQRTVATSGVGRGKRLPLFHCPLSGTSPFSPAAYRSCFRTAGQRSARDGADYNRGDGESPRLGLAQRPGLSHPFHDGGAYHDRPYHARNRACEHGLFADQLRNPEVGVFGSPESIVLIARSAARGTSTGIRRRSVRSDGAGHRLAERRSPCRC